MSAAPEQPSFDAYASDYEGALNRGLSLTGESRDFYARRRVEIMHDTCKRIQLQVTSVCDYGCGTGDTVPLLGEVLGARRLIGLDPSRSSLDEARRRHAGCVAEWSTPGSDESAALSGQMDAVYCNGVFHHIAPADRRQAAQEIMRLLRPGGCWFFWENNPLNPGTRWVMARIPFDRDAITLRSSEARRLGESAGGRKIETSFHFYFPKTLQVLRGAEKWLRRLPLGGQYLVVLQKPATADGA